jgi:uncharacterized alpha-E superfamily protein
VLKACSAFEPFRQTAGSDLTTARVAEFLLVHRHFPRSVLFCLKSCAESLSHIAERTGPGDTRPDRPRQLVGRLCAELEFLEIADVLGPAMQPFLDGLLRQVHQIGDELARAYFSARLVLPRARGGHPAPQEQQQQQQQ